MPSQLLIVPLLFRHRMSSRWSPLKSPIWIAVHSAPMPATKLPLFGVSLRQLLRLLGTLHAGVFKLGEFGLGHQVHRADALTFGG